MQNELDSLLKIKKTSDNIAITLGIVIGVILSIYFFTFSMLVNQPGAGGLVWFQAVSTVFFVFVLIYIKRIAFAVTRMLLGRHVPYKGIFATLTAAELDKRVEAASRR